MLSRFARLSLVWRPNARLAVVPVRRLEGTSTVEPDASADTTPNAESTRKRFDDSSKFDDMVEKLSAMANVQPTREQSSESAQFASEFISPAKASYETIDPDRFADATRSAKLTRQQSDDLSEFDFDEMVKQLSEIARSQPTKRSSESARFNAEFISQDRASNPTISRPSRYARKSPPPRTSFKSHGSAHSIQLNDEELEKHLERMFQGPH